MKEMPKSYDHQGVEDRLYENGKRTAISMPSLIPTRSRIA